MAIGAGLLAAGLVACRTLSPWLPQSRGARVWPEHLPVRALRVVRWSAHDDQTVSQRCRKVAGVVDQVVLLERSFLSFHGSAGTALMRYNSAIPGD
jgi:hypothetical protein